MIRFLIVSDIHALSRDMYNSSIYKGRAGGKLYIEDRTKEKNSILAIPTALHEYIGEIDVLFCLGDLAHQAKKAVAIGVWADIQRIAETLKISHVFGVTGNHDIGSRAEDFNNELPAKFLRQLYPPFPYNDEGIAERYALNAFASIEMGEAIIVLADTCSLHGYGGVNAPSIFDKGHLSEEAVNSIVADIKASSATYYILAMHHHPRRVDEISDPDYDQLPTGEYLLKELGKLDKPGMIVHGHKHFVAIRRGGTAANSPWILSASSLAANSYENMERFFSNQFHLVELERPGVSLAVQGRMFSWEWMTNQWVKSENEVMRHTTGFGAQKTPSEIAAIIDPLVSEGTLTIEEAAQTVADVQYLTNDGIRELKDELKRRHIHVYKGDYDQVAAFFRRRP